MKRSGDWLEEAGSERKRREPAELTREEIMRIIHDELEPLRRMIADLRAELEPTRAWIARVQAEARAIREANDAR